MSPAAQSSSLAVASRLGFQPWISAFVVLLSLLSVSSLQAQLSPPAFEIANKLYEEGKYADAAQAYEKLLQAGQVSAALYFNLGNAFFKSGQVGRAVAAYRQAERLTPRDPDIRANLQFARNQTQGPTLAASRWQRWLGQLSLNEWTALATGAVWIWLLLLTFLQWRPALKANLRGTVITLGILAAMLCSCLAVELYATHSIRKAVVITPDAVARYGPLDESQEAFTAHDGAELQVLDQKDQWLQVTAGPRRVGWIQKEQVLVLPRG